MDTKLSLSKHDALCIHCILRAESPSNSLPLPDFSREIEGDSARRVHPLVHLCLILLNITPLIIYFPIPVYLKNTMQSGYLNSPLLALVCVITNLIGTSMFKSFSNSNKCSFHGKPPSSRFNNLSTGINLENKKFNSVPCLLSVLML